MAVGSAGSPADIEAAAADRDIAVGGIADIAVGGTADIAVGGTAGTAEQTAVEGMTADIVVEGTAADIVAAPEQSLAFVEIAAAVAS